jgi:hypothetical protein
MAARKVLTMSVMLVELSGITREQWVYFGIGGSMANNLVLGGFERKHFKNVRCVTLYYQMCDISNSSKVL